MDPGSSCSKSISVCESSSGSVNEVEIVSHVKGHTSDSVSRKVLIGEQGGEENANKSQCGRENDSRMGKDGVRCSDGDNNVTVVSCDEAAENDTTSKAKSKEFHMVDLSGGGERICRICHFGSDQSPEVADDRVSSKSTSLDLIEIGCQCKNELGLAHFHCAEAWFKLKGNNVCEICGCTAKNVTVSSREGWSEVRDNTLDERRRRGRGQSCCIFIAFLLTIILLHWFFKKFSFYYKSP